VVSRHRVKFPAKFLEVGQENACLSNFVSFPDVFRMLSLDLILNKRSFTVTFVCSNAFVT